jgi:SAM-dependent methyltransferase
MDDPALDPQLHFEALKGLGRINFLSASSRILWGAIVGLALEREDGPLRILDLASGGGDVPLQLWRRAHRLGRNVHVEGCDISPRAVAFARERARLLRCPVHFFEKDVLAEDLPPGYDVLTASLFLHHLDDGEAVSLLGKMKAAAGSLVVVDDLRRSRLHYGLAHVIARLVSRSPVVHRDGPLSVQAAFTPAEVRQLAQEAGLVGARVVNHWPFRYLLSWRRENRDTDDSGSGNGSTGYASDESGSAPNRPAHRPI